MVKLTSRWLALADTIQGKVLRHLCWHPSQVFIYHCLSINCFHIIAGLANNVWLCLLLQGPQLRHEAYQSLWGCHDICPILEQFHIALVTQPELSSLTHLLVWGDPKRFHSNVSFLLNFPKRVLQREGVWACYGVAPPISCQSLHHRWCSKKLILLASSKPNWPYAFVQFKGDTHHMPLTEEGHLSTMMEEMPSNIPCRRICQLEVHQLLHSDNWIVYPKGLNRCLVPVITTVPKSLSHGVTMFDKEPTLLQVDISQFMMEGHKSKTPFSVVVQPLLLPHVLLWCLPPRQRVKSVWPWRSLNSYLRWLWTPLVKHWGVLPPKDQGPWP